jgi:hypothetical protein
VPQSQEIWQPNELQPRQFLPEIREDQVIEESHAELMRRPEREDVAEQFARLRAQLGKLESRVCVNGLTCSTVQPGGGTSAW